MKRAFLLSVVLSLSVSVGAEPFGELFPVTNTRYRTAIGEPRLVTNDRDFFLFWGAETKIRAARVDEGEARVSHAVLDTNEPFDVAWTGERHLIVSTRTDPDNQYISEVVGRVLDSEGHPTGPEFSVAPRDSSQPRIAAGAHSIAVVYTSGWTETRVVILSRNGRIESPSRAIAPGGTTHAVTRNGDGFLVIIAIHGGIRAVALDEHGQTTGETTFAVAPNEYREVAVGSDGTNALAVWVQEYSIVAVPVDANAGFGAPLEIERTRSPRTPTVVWNGANWTVSYAHASSVQSRAQIVQLDWRGQAILSREESPMGNGTPTVAALNGRILASWRPNGENMSPVIAALPLATSQPRAIPWVASLQTLLATASSAGATLMVWSEVIEDGVLIYAGVRSLQGQWNERRLATLPRGPQRAVAASDGNGFAIVVSGSSTSLIFIDSEARLSRAPVSLPVHRPVMAWNGTNYGLVDPSGRGILVGPTGEMSPVVSISMGFEPLALASDGNGFFVAGDIPDCTFACDSYPIRGIRLGPDLKRVDATDYIVKDKEQALLAGAAWDGSRYFLIAEDYEGSFIAYMPSSPSPAVATKKIASDVHVETMALLHDGTIAIAGRDAPNAGPDRASRVAFLSNDGAVLHTSVMEGVATTVPRLEPLTGDGLAFIASTMQDAGPHDGTSRIATAIARSSNVPPPGAPHIGVRVQNGMMRVDWTASAGTVNGYRLEYRIDDDEWVEWEQWFGPGEQNKSIRKPSFGTQFAFRVRAFNDGGAGEYSAVALTRPGRRRAVR